MLRMAISVARFEVLVEAHGDVGGGGFGARPEQTVRIASAERPCGR
jgi:hypothetical protein